MTKITDLLFEQAPASNPASLVFGDTAPAYVPVDLVFSQSPIGNPANLVFGGDDVVIIVDDVLAKLALTFQAITFGGAASYFSDTSRPVVGKVETQWQRAGANEIGVQASVRHMQSDRVINQSDWQAAKANPAGVTMALKHTLRSSRLSAGHRYQDGRKFTTGYLSQYAAMRPIARASSQTAWQDAAPVKTERVSSYQALRPVARQVRETGWQEAIAKRREVHSPYQRGKTSIIHAGSRMQKARRPPPGISSSTVPPVKNPCYIPPMGNAVQILFTDAAALNASLVFVCDHGITPPSTIVIPSKRTYIVLNNVQLRRVDGNHILPATTLSMQIDMDSWTWGFSTSMPASALNLVEPGTSGDLVILEASINGVPYLLIAEDIQMDWAFGKKTVTVSGRGISAQLADPYSPIVTFKNDIARTAQQLMNDALTVNGVSLGWSVDWRIDDWLVPAGVWSHQGSYMSAINTIAQAAGAFVQPDPVNTVLRIRPRYPVKPWEWASATADIELQSIAVVKESISWADKPDYNAVYVSGTTSGGVLGLVRRNGSAADKLAPMITDALTTDVIPARQRGIATLAETGRIATYSLSLPVMAETGIIEPGTMLKYVDSAAALGVVRGVSISTDQAKLRQTIEVQAHG
ncbi:hypothetical protein [Undibacterium sp. TJN19]|uniref:hypothetical protein n=1 Tax=Undibacterium sp. TJN19 TaxID=3413055 RepID=UPI003BF42267